VQLALAELGEDTPEERGRTRITESFLEWALQGENLEGGKLRCNGDIMGHTNKGIIGIRVDNVDGLTIRDVVIRDLENMSPLGSSICGEYWDTTQNSVRGTLLGYGATGVRGISLVASSGVVLDGNIEIRNLMSHYGSAVGIASYFGSACTLQGGLRVNRVFANTRVTHNDLDYLEENPLPNALPKACAIEVEGTSSVDITGSVRTDNIIGASGC
jgi:Uri superfamily endonuclease